MRRIAVLATMLVAAGALAAVAVAGPYIGPASKTRARVGELIHLKAGAGIRMYALLPLHLVSTKDALLPTPCKFKDAEGICEPRVGAPPRGGKYHRIGTLNVRREFRPELRRGPAARSARGGPERSTRRAAVAARR